MLLDIRPGIIDDVNVFWEKAQEIYEQNKIPYLETIIRRRFGGDQFKILYDHGPVYINDSIQGHLFCSFSPEIMDFYEWSSYLFNYPENDEQYAIELIPPFCNGIFVVFGDDGMTATNFDISKIVVNKIKGVAKEIDLPKSDEKPILGFPIDYPLWGSFMMEDEEINDYVINNLLTLCPYRNPSSTMLLETPRIEPGNLCPSYYLPGFYGLNEYGRYHVIKKPLEISFTPYIADKNIYNLVDQSLDHPSSSVIEDKELQIIFKPYGMVTTSVFWGSEDYTVDEFLCLNQKGQPFSIGFNNMFSVE